MSPPPSRRLLLVFDNLELSGADKVALDLMRASRDAPGIGLQFFGLVCMADKTGAACTADSLAFANPGLTPSTSILMKGLFGFRALWRCARMARTADVIIGVTPPAAFVAKVAATLTGKVAVAWVHYDIDGWQRELQSYRRSLLAKWIEVFFYRLLVPTFDNIVFVSDACRNSMMALRRRPIRHWQVISNIFSPSPFAPVAPDPGQLDEIRAGNGPRLLLLGRLARQKRWQDAIRLLELTSSMAPLPQLVVVGDGVERDAFLRAREASTARERIHWLGAVSDPTRILERVDVLILPSLYEAWPVVILEAFAFRVPVIAYACPSGPQQMLADGRGLCCDETPEAMTAALGRLLAMPKESRTAMLDAAQKFLEAHAPRSVLPAWGKYCETVS